MLRFRIFQSQKKQIFEWHLSNHQISAANRFICFILHPRLSPAFYSCEIAFNFPILLFSIETQYKKAANQIQDAGWQALYRGTLPDIRFSGRDKQFSFDLLLFCLILYANS